MIRPFSFAPAGLAGAYRIWPQRFSDGRGCLCKDYSREIFREAGIDFCPAETFWTESAGGVLRGLHFQKEHTQGKLVRVVSGEVFDVAVDCRPNSETFGKWVGVTLSAENKKQFYIPQGFAHGFLVLSEEAEFTYKCTDYYDPAAEGGVKWDDPDVGIVWPAVDGEIRLSAKDGEHRGFKEQTYEFFERW